VRVRGGALNLSVSTGSAVVITLGGDDDEDDD
jgi:hypothetical protein